jgi:predicted restriction endonuclease
LTFALRHRERYSSFRTAFKNSPLMPVHRYYWTAHWRQLRQLALQRDSYRCAISGCGARATIVDHIVTRPHVNHPTSEDRIDNLRSLCAFHDTQIKERRGVRNRQGLPVVKGVSADGWPRAGG